MCVMLCWLPNWNDYVLKLNCPGFRVTRCVFVQAVPPFFIMLPCLIANQLPADMQRRTDSRFWPRLVGLTDLFSARWQHCHCEPDEGTRAEMRNLSKKIVCDMLCYDCVIYFSFKFFSNLRNNWLHYIKWHTNLICKPILFFECPVLYDFSLSLLLYWLYFCNCPSSLDCWWAHDCRTLLHGTW